MQKTADILPAGLLHDTWDDFYSGSTGETVLKDRNLFRLEIEALQCAVLEHATEGPLHIVELGSGTGSLAQHLIEAFGQRQDISYVGVDFSAQATDRAQSRGIPNATFVEQDFLSFLKQPGPPIDMLIAQRSIMALVDRNEQRELLNAIRRRLAPGGVVILSEGTIQGRDALDALRQETGQQPLEKIWHCLYLDEDMVRELFDEVRIEDYASTYWLITRVIYPYGREAQHNTPVHDLAARLAQVGNYGLVKLIIAK